MTLHPVTPEELATALRAADRSRSPVGDVDLSALNRILEHTPEDMTVTVEAGVTLAALQRQLATRGQWLPIDPPHPERVTIAALLDHNLSGPRRHGCGIIRDHLIGVRVALADGRLIRSGGKVVKNVAGYDLLKLFVGARGTLGVIVEATFKLLPVPEAERFVGVHCAAPADVERFRTAVLDSELTPTVFDLHNLHSPGFDLVLGFSGVRQAVDHQVAVAAGIGIGEGKSLDYEQRFHDADQPAPQRVSVLPSRLVDTVRALGTQPFVARAGNGLIYQRAAQSAPRRELPLGLIERVKNAFDPNHVFPAVS